MSSLHHARTRRWFLTSPPAEWAIRRLRELLIGALRQGPVPRHVAFVMDGNRRFARSRQIETVEGHNLGFEALARILEVCYKSGVKVVTIYAFSIENFKRSKYEVDALMDMAKVKLSQLAQHGDLMDRYGASIRILGQRELVKPDVLEAIDEAVRMTSRNGDAILNVCFPYTSREEIATAIRETVVEYSTPTAGHEQEPSAAPIPEHASLTQTTATPSPRARSPTSSVTSDPEDSASSSVTLHTDTSPPHEPAETPNANYPDVESISAKTLNEHMYTTGNPPLDLLVRTSGVERLSDFMLWQCHEETDVVFLKCLWPEFDLWQFLPVLVEWQWRRRKLEEKPREMGIFGGRGVLVRG